MAVVKIFMLHTVLVMILTYYSLSEGFKNEIYSSKSDFLTVSKTSAFVDKTMLLKTIFEKPEMKLITAPRKFGKSTNLQMIKQFLSIQSMQQKQIWNTFAKLKIYKNDPEFFENNFGKWPVLFVDYKTKGTITSFEDAVEQFKISIHDSYLEHEYLKESNLLDEETRQLCRMWYGNISFRKMTESDTALGLRNLARCLNKHFNKSVIFLVDEYDCIINKALFRIEEDRVFEDIVELTSSILGNVLKSSVVDVEVAVVTGVSYISSCGLSDINNLKRYRFLENHDFVQFYGFTQKEVEFLFEKKELNLDLKEIKKAYILYNGYKCRLGRKIYNTFSILTFIEEGEARNHSLVSGYSTNLVNCFKYPGIEKIIGRLLMGESVKINFYYDIDIYHVFELRKTIFKEVEFAQPNEDLLFCYFLELGLLTHDTRKTLKKGEVYVKLPNLEVNNNIFRLYKDYYINKYHLRREDVSNATNYSALRKVGALIYKRGEKEIKAYLDEHTTNWIRSILDFIVEWIKKVFLFPFFTRKISSPTSTLDTSTMESPFRGLTV